MKDLLFFLSSLIVNDINKLTIKEVENNFSKKFLIKVAKNDIKNIIGREGKTIKTIRNIISMASVLKGNKKKIPIEIIDE
ncbi:MAG: KH domain-containing protein [Candidatus Goldbacteria bacterium]|nr:KH domain-containing protein [Candidatus Goldiibacteriota bacterium]